MAEEERFDAVVVGAGPAGTAAALTMAKAGLQVALLERGSKPGSKNVMGGILYNHFLEEIVGDASREAPLDDDAGSGHLLRLQESSQPDEATLVLGPSCALCPVVCGAGRESRSGGR